jgi:hypothetical protein
MAPARQIVALTSGEANVPETRLAPAARPASAGSPPSSVQATAPAPAIRSDVPQPRTETPTVTIDHHRCPDPDPTSPFSDLTPPM